MCHSVTVRMMLSVNFEITWPTSRISSFAVDSTEVTLEKKELKHKDSGKEELSTP